MTEETLVNKTQNEERRLPCGRCNVKTRHKVLQSVDVEGEDPDWPYNFTDNYQIVQCQGCDEISFRKCHMNSEDVFFDEDEGVGYPILKEELYPSRVVGRPKLRQGHFLPSAVSRIYDETHAALCNKQPILAGVGVRALIEAVCKEESATGRDLEKKIDDLVTKGVLTRNGAEILHGLRIIGNVAAHEVKPHTEEQLNLAMDVVEHLLTDVYILPAATDKLPKRDVTGTS